MGIRFIRF